MKLPQNTKLPISALAGIFSNTTATYKFYWFVAMMDIVVKERRTKMSYLLDLSHLQSIDYTNLLKWNNYGLIEERALDELYTMIPSPKKHFI